MALTPTARARAWRQMRQNLDSIPYFRLDAAATEYLEAEIQQLEIQQAVPIMFEWVDTYLFRVDDTLVHANGKGLALAWIILAGLQHRLTPVDARWVFPGRSPAASALQALERAAGQLEDVNADLARIIRDLGTRRGVFVQRRHAQRQVQCIAPPAIRNLAQA